MMSSGSIITMELVSSEGMRGNAIRRLTNSVQHVLALSYIPLIVVNLLHAKYLLI